ncbi:MAG: hypothetical protein AB8I69_09350 [Anaerolineae bacterium]|jgi:hypothetical protein
MKDLSQALVKKYVNVGTPLVLMGGLWLYLWVFWWYGAYVAEPHWGHNYLEAAAFLIVGLAYYNRRLISDLIALTATTLIVPVSLEMLPHWATAITGGVLIVLTIVDMLVEREREIDLLQPANRRLSFWLKGHVLRFAFIMLAHLSLIYFFVRLPGGTYETDLVTKVFDAALIPIAILGLLDGAVKKLGSVSVPQLGFFAGMASLIASLVILIGQPETWVCMAIVLFVTVAAVVALIRARQQDSGEPA